MTDAVSRPRKLTNTAVERAIAGLKRYVIWDTDLPGFGLRVETSGSRSFVIKYRVGTGRRATQRFMTVASYPKLDAAKARDEAKRLLGLAAARTADPAADRKRQRDQLTVAQLVALYEAEGCFVQRGARIGEPMKELTKRYTLARLHHHVVPILGRRPAAELTQGDIEAFARQVAKGQTAKDEKSDKTRGRVIVRGGEGAARKVIRDLSAVLSFAQRRRIVAENVVATAAVRKTDNRRERFLSTDEVSRLGEALDELGQGDSDRRGTRGSRLGALNKKALDITRLWALTGCRRNEIAALEWTNVELSLGLLIFDDTKTGRSIRPLAAPAAALLAGLKAEAEEGAKYVFPAERGEGFYQGTKGVWPEVVKRAGLPGVTPHTLRHTLGAAAASGGEGLLLVGAILGHANARSTAIYAHVDRDPARLAANRATAGIAAALGRLVKPNDPGQPAPARRPA